MIFGTKKQYKMKEKIKTIAEQIANQRRFAKIQRKRYEFDEQYMLRLIEEIGAKLCYNEFVIDNNNRDCYLNVLKWLAGKPFEAINPNSGTVISGDINKGLYIAGGCGTGKSLLMTIIAGIASFYNVEYQFEGQKVAMCWTGKRTDEICNEFILQGCESINTIKNQNIICLNDLASEQPEQMYMGNRMNIIRQIIESRADQFGKFTLITSNYPMNHKRIIEWYGDRVASRLQGMCNYLELKGKDRRVFNKMQ